MLAALVSPANDNQISYTHVLFEWEQEPGASTYLLQISESSDMSNPIQISTSGLVHIQQSSIDWDSSYYWNVTSYDSQGLEVSVSETNQFSTGSPVSGLETNIYYPEQYSDGITIFGSFFDYNSIAFDMDGNEIWHDDSNSIVYYNTDYYGQLFGCQQDTGLEHDLPAVEFNLDAEVLWMDPNDEFAHHDMIQLPNGNYMSLVEEVSLGHIPGNLLAASNFSYYNFMCNLLGYQCDGVTNEFNWIGDKIVEWDAETKEVVWEWSVHDYFSKHDYDEGLWASILTSDAAYDWTHVNAPVSYTHLRAHET